jgi:uncharacterized membrane protein
VNARLLARAALYAAAYAGLTLAPGLSAFAYGPVQFRVSEALTVFACFDPAAVAGLTVGTAIANVASPIAVLDVPFGAALTLLATWAMWRIGPRWAALAVPVVVNGLGVGLELALLTDVPYLYAAGFVALGEAVVLFTGGAALLAALRRHAGRLGLPGRTPPRVTRDGDEARRTR